MLRAAFAVLLPRLLVLLSLLIYSGVVVVVVVALRMTSLQIPEHVVLNETVRMQCNFNLDKAPLYSVKWYKDGHEFYRYTPRDAPVVLTFPVPGVNVNRDESTESSVVLNNVNLTSSGRYRCEVSGEAPAFDTVSDHGDMTVVVLPNEGPQITGGRSKYQVGDVVHMNCTSAPSKPPALLSWFINDEPANTDYLTGPDIVNEENGLETARLGLKFRVANKHFRRGDMKLKCLATIATVYLQSNEESVEGDESILKTPIIESRETRAQSHTREDLTNGSASVAVQWTILVVALITSIAAAR
ncbi:PREDICTED: cell adhesion molecule 2-like [Vollenhovia emeryi]|uniref:cell adhesion molecule 2-like n=1 Tax=Vollenhovia emeryi TaxID=411798 RepID=UPI0005F57EC6|nr:PREDICTED: cell adhesion molecule 2-like [Vollenhovia emeryi]